MIKKSNDLTGKKFVHKSGSILEILRKDDYGYQVRTKGCYKSFPIKEDALLELLRVGKYKEMGNET